MNITTHLSDELFQHIGEFLPLKDLHRFSITSRAIHETLRPQINLKPENIRQKIIAVDIHWITTQQQPGEGLGIVVKRNLNYLEAHTSILSQTQKVDSLQRAIQLNRPDILDALLSGFVGNFTFH
jgi:hypothetical protein